jgi:hypothetical protein
MKGQEIKALEGRERGKGVEAQQENCSDKGEDRTMTSNVKQLP